MFKGYLAFKLYQVILQNFHEYIDSKMLSDMISETIPVLLNRVRVKDIVFKSSICFLLNCIIYSPIQTLKRLESGN